MRRDSPLLPWHMWGNQIRFDLAAQGIATPRPIYSGQLLRVSYKRPTTWSFWFAAELLQIDEIIDQYVVVLIDVITGVGRSSVSTLQPLPGTNPHLTAQSFVKFAWLDTGAPAADQRLMRWTTRGTAWPTDDFAEVANPGSSTWNVDWLAAQDIQVQVRAFQSVGAAKSIIVNGFVAPRTHIRPDWFGQANQFRGDETGGT